MKDLKSEKHGKKSKSSNLELEHELEHELEKLRQENTDLLETLKRKQAEYENYIKRAEKEVQTAKEYSSHEIISKLLNVIDTFEIALKNTKDPEKFIEGMKLIYSQIIDTLEREGLKKIESKGMFDPFKHDVLLSEISEKPEGTILEELQSGYMLKDKVLRHAKVKVSKGKPNKNSEKIQTKK